MSRTEVAAAYLQALAAWASDNPPLAACHPEGPPACVGEDMEVLGTRFPRSIDPCSPLGAGPLRAGPLGAGPLGAGPLGTRLTELAGIMVRNVLADTSVTPLGAFGTVRDEVLRLLREPADRIAERVSCSVAELSDRLIDRTGDEPVLTARQVIEMLAALSGLSSLLATGLATGPGAGEGEDQ
jgi:hypothetical protein